MYRSPSCLEGRGAGGGCHQGVVAIGAEAYFEGNVKRRSVKRCGAEHAQVNCDEALVIIVCECEHDRCLLCLQGPIPEGLGELGLRVALSVGELDKEAYQALYDAGRHTAQQPQLALDGMRPTAIAVWRAC
jgi:hypothetical protein